MASNDYTAELAVILPIESKDGIDTVDARVLHEWLEVTEQFSSWIKRRISAYGFVQGVDFIAISNSLYSPPRTEYHVSTDMGKQLGMVERTEKGRGVRQYFIACEKAAKAVQPALPSYPEALRQLASSLEAQAALEHKIEQDAPKVAFAERLEVSADCISMEAMAKMLRTGRNRLFAFLRQKKIILSYNSLPYQKYIDNGWFRLKETTWTDSHGRERISITTQVTGKGQQALRRLVDDQGLLH